MKNQHGVNQSKARVEMKVRKNMTQAVTNETAIIHAITIENVKSRVRIAQRSALEILSGRAAISYALNMRPALGTGAHACFATKHSN